MSTPEILRRDRLWNLLPEFHRIKDAEAGYPARALLGAIGMQFSRVEADVENLWNDHFIETCEPWVVPYLADLLGIEPIHDVDGTARVDVARTISFRKRQGTLPMLEQLSEAVTRWETVVAEMFRRMSWTQHLNHQDETRTNIDLRNPAPLQLLDGAFDPHMHTVDVREPSVTGGRPNISNVAFFLHRLVADPLSRVSPKPLTNSANSADEWRFFLHPMRIDVPMFHRFDDDNNRNLRMDEDEAHAAIRTGWLAGHLKGPHRSSSAVADFQVGEIVLLGKGKDAGYQWQCADLSTWRQPPPGKLYIDPMRARVTIAPQDRQAALAGPVIASFASGTPGPIGANGLRRAASTVYNQTPWLPRPSDADPEGWHVLTVGKDGLYPTLNDALAAWVRPKTIIRITDSATYEESLSFVPRSDFQLVLQAADTQRPFITGNVRLIGGSGTPPIDDRMRLAIDGVWINGCVRVTGGAAVDEIVIVHSSVWQLEQGEDGAVPTADRGVVLLGSVNSCRISHASIGGIETSSAVDMLVISDCIVDGHGGAALSGDGGIRSGPATLADRTTFMGSVLVREIDASECIFSGLVEARRVQTGCIRYSFVPSQPSDSQRSRTPRRYRCQPDLAIEEKAVLMERALDAQERRFIERSVTPRFVSTQPFDPAYATLAPNSPVEIRRGAVEGLEIGAWNLLRNPHRVDNLQQRTIDYLPYGLRPELVYVN